MSVSLIRRGLDLFNDDIKADVQKDKKKQKGGEDSKKGVMDQISTNRQGVTKRVRRLKGGHVSGQCKSAVKDKRIKSALEEFQKKKQQSQLSKNLSYFLGSDYGAEKSYTDNIQHQTCGRQSRHRPAVPVMKQKNQKSHFTEEEFQEFQKAYFGKTVEGSGQ